VVRLGAVVIADTLLASVTPAVCTHVSANTVVLAPTPDGVLDAFVE
jgi:hypothetical protein